MKRLYTVLMFTILANTLAGQNNYPVKNKQFMQSTKNDKLKITAGEKTFTAMLSESPTANAFKALLPLTLTMNELNNNEKYALLPKSLPASASVPASIQSGDLMLYGSNTLVLFYKGFTTSYSYTKIGKVENMTGLAAALGAGDVKVSFEVIND